MPNNILALCEKIVQLSEKKGASAAEVYAEVSEDINVSIERNDLKMCDTRKLTAIGLRVLKDKSIGYAFTNDLKTSSIKAMIESAFKLASAAPSDVHNILPKPKKIKAINNLYDKNCEQFDIEDAIRYAQSLLSTARGFDSRISVDSAAFSASVLETAVVNSYGINCSERTTRFDYFIMGMAIEGSEVSSFNYQYDGTRFVKEIDVEKVATEFARTVLKSLGAKKPKSFKGTVFLTPEAVDALIGGNIAFLVDANNVQKGLSRFKNCIETEIAVKALTVIDDGTLPAGLGSESFDREGMPHKSLKIIENGILKSYLYNTYTAAKDACKNTAHAGGSIRQAPQIETTNFIIEPGREDSQDLQNNIKKGIVVTRFSGFPDPISGEFSGVVKGGWLIENGVLKTPILETTIAGNFFELLKSISAISKDTKKIECSVLPYVCIENLSIISGRL